MERMSGESCKDGAELEFSHSSELDNSTCGLACRVTNENLLLVARGEDSQECD